MLYILCYTINRKYLTHAALTNSVLRLNPPTPYTHKHTHAHTHTHNNKQKTHTTGATSGNRYPANQLVSGGADFAIILWDLCSGTQLQRFVVQAGPILQLMVTPPTCSVSWVGERLERDTLIRFLVWFRFIS